MSKKNKNFRRKNNKKKEQTNLSIKVGDWFKSVSNIDPTLYHVDSIETNVVFTYIHCGGSIETGFKVCANNELMQSEESGSDLILTDLDSSTTTRLVPISEKSACITLKCNNRDLCYILDCFNLPQSQSVSSEDTKLEKLKKSKYLKYVKDNKIYYLYDPIYEKNNIFGQEKFLVTSSGITIINNQVRLYYPNNILNLIRLMFDNEEEFFNNVKEITKEEFDKLWSDLI